MIVVISDVHGNAEALQAVLGHVKGGDVVCCAGDIVGYGPNPNECCEILRSRGIPSVMGNHDFVCANFDRLDGEDATFADEERALCRRIYEGKNTVAKASSRWCNKVLEEENKRFLRGLPLKLEVQGLTIVHGKPGTSYDMLNEYVFPSQGTEELTRHIEGRVLVVGHSHIPMRSLHVINPGSVGQPRDRNWMASYARLDPVRFKFKFIRDEDFSFRIVSEVVDICRVPYDMARTIEKIKAEPELADSLGDRLTVGL
jgi:predicted phosphodiesterase